FEHAFDAHFVQELDLTFLRQAGDGRGAAGLGRAGERDVALAGEKAGGRVEADPTRAGQVRLAPGVQVGEVVLGARRTVERLYVRLELDQVARDEARRDADVAQELHQEPSRVAARAALERERFLRRLQAGLEANHVADV